MFLENKEEKSNLSYTFREILDGEKEKLMIDEDGLGVAYLSDS